jgi:hypothetical protein
MFVFMMLIITEITPSPIPAVPLDIAAAQASVSLENQAIQQYRREILISYAQSSAWGDDPDAVRKLATVRHQSMNGGIFL